MRVPVPGPAGEAWWTPPPSRTWSAPAAAAAAQVREGKAKGMGARISPALIPAVVCVAAEACKEDEDAEEEEEAESPTLIPVLD